MIACAFALHGANPRHPIRHDFVSVHLLTTGCRHRVSFRACNYDPRIGRPSIDPVLMIRILMIGYVFAIRSERALCRDVQVNFAYRWFCGLSIEDKIPDHSAFSRARNERFRDGDPTAWPLPITRAVRCPVRVHAGSHRAEPPQARQTRRPAATAGCLMCGMSVRSRCERVILVRRLKAIASNRASRTHGPGSTPSRTLRFSPATSATKSAKRRHNSVQQISTGLRSNFASCLAFSAAW